MIIPEFLLHLPVYQGLPVPYAQMWFNGVPDFRVIDHDKVETCINERLCALCGKHLGRYAWFVGGPRSMDSGFFMDPPMHEHCARFAVETCPFLNGNKTTYNIDRPVTAVDGIKVQTCQEVTTERPRKIGIRRAHHYGLVRSQGSTLIQVTHWYGQPLYLA